MSLEEEIRTKLSSPRELERIFRSNDEREFSGIILKLYNQDPSNIALSFWKERITFDSDASLSKTEATNSQLLLVIILSVFAGLYAKLPAIFSSIDEKTFYPANIPFFVFSALIAFFIATNKPQKSIVYAISIFFLLCLTYTNALSSFFAHPLSYRLPDTMTLAYMHMPFVLCSLLGVSFVANDLHDHSKRIRFLSYIGETLIYSVIILIGGMIMTFLTFGLFSAIKVQIEQWYMQWVVVFGSVAAPIVATYISTNRFVLSGKIAPLMAKIFSPLFLLTLVAYLAVVAVQGKSPFTDRDFLIVFNAMLIIVLAITVFAIVERPSQKSCSTSDYINFALLCVALLINVVALAAILFRLTSYGFTPNRTAVLGSNAIIFIHLLLISKSYINFLMGKTETSLIHQQIATYLPVYTIWTSIVAFAFPLLFAFK